MENIAKRKAEFAGSKHSGRDFKKQKTSKSRRTPHVNASRPGLGSKNQTREPARIEPGDAGIWATCEKGKEAKCVNELRDLFQEFAERYYVEELEDEAERSPEGNTSPVDREEKAPKRINLSADDIESQIQSEVTAMKNPASQPMFTNVWIDMQCVFLKTRPPIRPAQFVHALCKDLMQSGVPRTRYSKRLTPMTSMGKATAEGLDEVATKVLNPHFHSGDGSARSFAIRPSIRNSAKTLTRDDIIKRVASLVGQPHRVDLTRPDLVILIELYKFHIGLSVVDGDYDLLKRYNLAEIYEVASKPFVDEERTEES